MPCVVKGFRHSKKQDNMTQQLEKDLSRETDQNDRVLADKDEKCYHKMLHPFRKTEET